MRAASPSLTVSARGCLVLLGILLGASLAIRAYAYAYARIADPGAVTSLPPIDLGAGVSLPRASAGHPRVLAGPCASPVLVTFVWVGPYGPDPSLEDARHPDDRVYYVYRGWNLGRRFATIGLNAIYFIGKAHARLSLSWNPLAHDIAVKIVVPAGCDASPDDVLASLRRQVTTAE